MSQLKKELKNFISGHQTENTWTLSELDEVVLSRKYASKQVPKGRRKKPTTAALADGGYLLQTGRATERKERVEEQRVKEGE